MIQMKRHVSQLTEDERWARRASATAAGRAMLAPDAGRVLPLTSRVDVAAMNGPERVFTPASVSTGSTHPSATPCTSWSTGPV